MNGNYKNWRRYGHKPCYINDIKEYDTLKIKKCNFNIIERIGEHGSISIVYNIDIEGYNFALKILPIFDKDNITTNEEEIYFATFCSNIVKKGECPYFPYVIDSGYCQHFEYPEGDTLKTLSKEYMESIGNYQDTPINYLISELATMDLASWIKHYYDEEILVVFVRDVMEAIQCLQNNKILQSDMHLYNVLIMDRNGCGKIACIHDFGRTRYINSAGDYLFDYMRIIKELHKNVDIDLIKKMFDNMNNDWNSVNDKKEFIFYVLEKYFNV